jgi:Immunity protein Imm1
MARRKQPDAPWRITVVEGSNYDNRNRANRRPVENPTWAQVQAAILSLDAHRRSDMSIEAADGSCMVIGGGLGRYTVATQCGRESQAVVPASLFDSSRGDDEEELIVGGCTTPLPARYIVDEEKTLRAAQRFYQDGTLEASLEWEPY